jgi:vacuolar-type H+-ATPase subunit I/STV1
MKREDLIAMGLSEENADKIMADYGSSVQRAKAKVDEYKTKADKAEELQKQLDDIEQGKLTEVEQANKNLEKANARIAELEKAQAIATQRADAASKFNVTAEQATQIVKDDGGFDYDVLGKIISEKETAAAQAKEQEIANGSTNPGGGTAGGNKDNEKAEAEKAAESIGKTLAGTNQTAKSVVDSYLS